MNLFIAALLLAQAGDDATLSGRVSDAVTHQPIPGARVFYVSSSAISDENGAWSIRIRPGPRDAEGPFTVTKKGYDSFDWKPAEPRTLNIELSPVAHISGHIVDKDSGMPLAGFAVVVHRQPYLRPFGSKASGTDGSYAVDGDLPSGQYLLEIVNIEEKPNRVGYGRSWYPGVPRIEMAAPVTLSPGEHRDVEIRLQKRELHHIAGTLHAPEGREGERISIELIGPEGRQIAAKEIPNAGPFLIDGVDEGTYEIAATLPAPDRAFAIERLDITDRDIDDLKLTLRPGVSLRGVITMAEKDGTVPAGVSMWVGPMPDSSAHALGASSAIQSADHLFWQGLPAGEYWPMLTLPQGYALSSVTYAGRPVFNTEIDIEAPESTVNFVVTSRPSGVTGTVRDSDQNLVTEATIVLLQEPLPASMEKFSFFALRIATCDRNGTFHLSGLGPGRYKAIVLTGKDRQRDHELDFLHDRVDSAEAIDLDPGQTATVDLHIK